MSLKHVCVGKVVDEYGEFYIFRESDSPAQFNFKKINPKLFTGKNITIPQGLTKIGSFKTNQIVYSIFKEIG